MRELTYFDAYAEYGPRPGKHIRERWTLDHLLDDLDLAGISGALVRHSQGPVYDAGRINHRLIREIERHRDRLFPCWTVVPPVLGEFPEPRELLRQMGDHNVAATVIYPRSCGLPIFEPYLAPLAEALAENLTLLLVSYRELNGFDGAHRFLEIFREMPVLLTDATWSQWREVQLLMDHHGNLHLEFSSFQANRAIEVFGERYGYDRLLFGTNLPFKAPGTARGMLDWRLFDDDTAQQVAGGNLRWLLKGDGPPETHPTTEWTDTLTTEARLGEPLSCQVLNAHCHVLHDGASWAGGPHIQPRGDIQGILQLNQRVGIDGTALMSWNGTVSMDMADGNAVTAAAVAQAPDRLIGAVTLDPTHMDHAMMQRQAQRYHLELGFRGLKHDLATTIPMNHPRLEPWWKFGDEQQLYVLFDQNVSGLPPILDVAKRHPNLHVLIAHTGRGFDYAEHVVAMAKECPNVYAELTYTLAPNGLIEWLCEEIGSERVIFGTDSPMRDPRPQVGWVVWTRLGEEDKRRILGGNFARILGEGRLPGHELAGVFRRMDER